MLSVKSGHGIHAIRSCGMRVYHVLRENIMLQFIKLFISPDNNAVEVESGTRIIVVGSAPSVNYRYPTSLLK